MIEQWNRIVKAHANKPAIAIQQGILTFKEMDDLSTVWASKIIDLEAEIVCLVLPPSVDYYALWIGCMKAGKTVFPVDAFLPLERLVELIPRNDQSFIITDQASLLEEFGVKYPLMVSLDNFLVRPSSEKDLSNVAFSHQYSHIMFTSGSTGTPSKIYHLVTSLINDISTTYEVYGVDKNSPILNLGYYTSSMHFNGFWRTLIHGQTFVSGQLNTERVNDLMGRLHALNVTTWQGQPSLLDGLINQVIKKDLEKIQHLILGGEPLKKKVLQRWVTLMTGLKKITYNFSSTETMLITSITRDPNWFLREERIPVGFAGPSKLIKIVNENGQEVKQGDVGQIVVISAYLAHKIEGMDGYKKLVPIEYSTQKIYFTGDLGKIDQNGFLIHLGRIDRRIKINGNRIDPLLIEEKLEGIHGVLKSKVLSIEHQNFSILAAALVTSYKLDPNEIRIYLAKVLPNSHIPAFIHQLDHFPSTKNGKPNLSALYTILESAYKEQKSEIHNKNVRSLDGLMFQLHQLWSQILKNDTINPDSSIFNQGADSLYAVIALQELNATFHTNHAIGFIWKYPTLRQQAQYLYGKIEGAKST